MWQPSFATPRAGELHLRLFLLGSAVCDCDHPAVVALSRALVGRCSSVAEAAASVRAWVREHVVYTLQDKSDRASDTLAKREGMCTNKANLQVAILRAAGIPAGYSLVHVTKEAFAGPHTLPDLLELISPITLHVFCSVYVPAEELIGNSGGVSGGIGGDGGGSSGDGGRSESDGDGRSGRPYGASASESVGATAVAADAADAAAVPPDDAAAWGGDGGMSLGAFRCYDATERPGSDHLIEHVRATDETRYHARWRRGPVLPPQGCLDPLLLSLIRSKIPPELLAAQNALWRTHRI